MSQLFYTMSNVAHERLAQIEKWGDSFEGRSQEEWLMVLLEEIGEALQEPAGSRTRAAELIQVSAVAAAWSQHCHEETVGVATWYPTITFNRGDKVTNITHAIRRIGLEAQRLLNERFN